MDIHMLIKGSHGCLNRIARIVIVRYQDAQQFVVVEHQNINLYPLWDFHLLLRTIDGSSRKILTPYP